MAATASHPDPNTSLWARYRGFVCRSHALDKGRISTFVQLYRAVAQPNVRLYPMHTNTWFYIRADGAASSSDIKTVSYRYATHRTQSVQEPFQDEAFGSCQGKTSAEAVASYVANNAAGLSRAVDAHRAGDAAISHGPALASFRMPMCVRMLVAATGVACLLAVGVVLVRTARAHTLPKRAHAPILF